MNLFYDSILYQYQLTIDDNFKDDKIINLNDFTSENIITINDISDSNQTFDNNELGFDSKVILESLFDLTYIEEISVIFNPDSFTQYGSTLGSSHKNII